MYYADINYTVFRRYYSMKNHILFFILLLSSVHGYTIETNPLQLKNTKYDLQSTLTTLPSPQDVSHEEMVLSFFLEPIQFTKDGIERYFKYMYNHEQYPQFLAHDLSHMLQLLDYGVKSNNSYAYASAVIHLFSQKIKCTQYVNAYGQHEFLEHFAQNVLPYLQKPGAQSTFVEKAQKTIKDYLSSMMSKYFSFMQKQPDEFLDVVSEQVAKINYAKNLDEAVQDEHLKKDIVKFLDLLATKTMWDVQELDMVWINMHAISQVWYQLFEKNIINDVQDYNDLCWSLMTRFCHLVEISKDEIDVLQIQNIIQDIESKEYILFYTQEVEDAVTTKKEYMLRTLYSLFPQVKTMQSAKIPVITGRPQSIRMSPQIH